MRGVKGESRLVMDKEAGAKTRHVALVVRRFQDADAGFVLAMGEYRWMHADDVDWGGYCMVRSIYATMKSQNTTNLCDIRHNSSHSTSP